MDNVMKGNNERNNMTPIILSELDLLVNGKKSMDTMEAMENVAKKYIKKQIDKRFKMWKFRAWLNSGYEGPFKCNGKLYYWNEEDLQRHTA